jgi:TatD DNase family protein
MKLRQKELFDQHIRLAMELGKPLMIHARPSKGSMDAYEDVLVVLELIFKKYPGKISGNFHFFVGDLVVAKRVLDLGFTMSFDGPITFARDYDEVIKYIPLDMILSETDAPFAAPAPYRGKRNEPAYVEEIVKKIAEIRGEDFEKVRETLVQNAIRVFKLSI